MCAAKATTSSDGEPQTWLLVSDVDSTLTDDAEALRRFVETVRQSHRLRVVLNSSRPRRSVEATLLDWPDNFMPHGMITAMGTEVAVEGRGIAAWTEQFAGFDRRPIDAVMARLGYPPHDPHVQTPYKASVAVPAGDDVRRARDALAETGLDLQIVASGQSDFDVLPPGAGKGPATRFIAERLGVDLARVMVAGDSGNDVAMFEVSDRGIVVGNARTELREAVDPSRAYLAQAHHADGVLEGMRRWGAPIIEA